MRPPFEYGESTEKTNDEIQIEINKAPAQEPLVIHSIKSQQ